MDNRVAKLVMKKKIIQRSPEWYNIRENLITASSASSLLIKDDTVDPYIKEYRLEDVFLKDKKCCNPYSSKTQFIADKVNSPKFKGSVATYHGQKYEDVVSDIYRNKYNKEIIEFGIIQHEKYSWLGASPDGITPEGVMIEIKCPYRRKITGIPPLYYWIQVQLQLEVCDLEVCDFAEYEFTEFETAEEFIDDTTINASIFHKGAVIAIHSLDNNNVVIFGETKYIYPPRQLLDNTRDIIEWVSIKTQELNSDFKDNPSIRIDGVYWKVFDYSITRIFRNKEWFKSVTPVFEKAWNEISFYKKQDNYKHLINSIQIHDNLDGKTLHLDLDNQCVLSDNE
jgi:putative phage-type endonuclease